MLAIKQDSTVWRSPYAWMVEPIEISGCSHLQHGLQGYEAEWIGPLS